MPKNQPLIEINSSLSLSTAGRSWGSARRMALLAAIAEHGSISAAARHINITYKAAWDAIETMNNLAGEPLVERTTGGAGGGGARLTQRANELLRHFQAYDRMHQRFMNRLSQIGQFGANNVELLQAMMLQTSARNNLQGVISAIKTGAVNDEIILDIGHEQQIVASITSESTQNLGLKIGQKALAFLKASSVLVGVNNDGATLSARNQLAGKITRIIPGAVNAEVSIELAPGQTITATITLESVRRLGLQENQVAYAIFKASSVMLATLE